MISLFFLWFARSLARPVLILLGGGAAINKHSTSSRWLVEYCVRCKCMCVSNFYLNKRCGEWSMRKKWNWKEKKEKYNLIKILPRTEKFWASKCVEIHRVLNAKEFSLFFPSFSFPLPRFVLLLQSASYLIIEYTKKSRRKKWRTRIMLKFACVCCAGFALYYYSRLLHIQFAIRNILFNFSFAFRVFFFNFGSDSSCNFTWMTYYSLIGRCPSSAPTFIMPLDCISLLL